MTYSANPAAGRLQDKVAVLTGAASGIGEAVASRYLGEGARCVLVDVKPAADIAPQLAADHPDRVFALSADVTRREDIDRIMDGVPRLHRTPGTGLRVVAAAKREADAR